MALLKEGKTNWKFILIVLILALLVGGGILLWAKIQEVSFTQLPQMPQIKKPETPPQDETADLSAKDLTTEDWKTYRNEGYGYEVKYPKDGRIKEEGVIGLPFISQDLLFDNEAEVHMEVTKTTPEKCSPDPRQGFAESMIIIEKDEKVRINNIEFTKEFGAVSEAGLVYEFISYSTMKGNNCFRLIFILIYAGFLERDANLNNIPRPNFDRNKAEEIFNQMLSTFRFIE